jgi:hypothetical protein
MGRSACPSTITVYETRPNPYPGGTTHITVPVQKPCPRCGGRGWVETPDPWKPPPPRPPRPRKPKQPKQPKQAKAKPGRAPAGGGREPEGDEPVGTTDSVDRDPRPERGAASVEQFLGVGIAGLAVWLTYRGGARFEWYWWPLLFVGATIASVLFLNRFQAVTKILCAILILGIIAGIIALFVNG